MMTSRSRRLLLVCTSTLRRSPQSYFPGDITDLASGFTTSRLKRAIIVPVLSAAEPCALENLITPVASPASLLAISPRDAQRPENRFGIGAASQAAPRSLLSSGPPFPATLAPSLDASRSTLANGTSFYRQASLSSQASDHSGQASALTRSFKRHVNPASFLGSATSAKVSTPPFRGFTSEHGATSARRATSAEASATSARRRRPLNRSESLRVFIVAGEPSGDAIGCRLMAALRDEAERRKGEIWEQVAERDCGGRAERGMGGDGVREAEAAQWRAGTIEFQGVGGPWMASEGLNSLFPMTDLSTMGFAEIIPRIPLLWYRLRQAVRHVERFQPHIIVTIDSKGFNFRLLKAIGAEYKRHGRDEEAPFCVHYVAPSFWAFKGGEKRLQLSHPHLVRGLILVSPLLSAPSWSEWAYNKVTMNVLSYYGMTSYIKDSLFDRYFCPARWGFHGPASDALMSFRRELDYHEPENLMRYFYAIQRRRNLLPLLSSLQVPVLLAVGDMSPFNLQARTAFHHLRAKVSAGPSESKLKWEDEKESGVEEEEEEGGNARGRRGREKQAAAVSRDHQGGAVGDRVRRRGGRICEWRECEERGGNDGVALAGEDQVGRGSEEGWTGGAERDWEREQESESQGSSTRMEDWQKGGGCVLWVEVEACGSLVTEERPHTLFPSLCRFVAKLRPTQYQQWQQWQQLPAAQWSLAPCPFQRGATDAEASGGLAEERGKVEGEAQEGEQDRQQQNQLQQWQRVHRQQQVHSTAPLLRDRSHREAPFCIPLFSQHLTQEQHQEKQQQHREKQQQQQQQSSVVQSSQAWPSHTSKAANLVCTIPSPITSHPLKSPSLSGSQLPSPSSIPPLISPSTSTPSTCTPSVTTPSTSAQSVCTPSARTPLFWTPGSTPADLSPARMLPPSAVNHPPLVNRSGSVSEAGLVALLLPSEAGAAGKGVGKQMLSRGCRCVGVPGSEVEGLRSGEEVSGEREQLLRLECERARLRPVRIHGVARRWEEVVPQTGFEMCGSPTS